MLASRRFHPSPVDCDGHGGGFGREASIAFSYLELWNVDIFRGFADDLGEADPIALSEAVADPILRLLWLRLLHREPTTGVGTGRLARHSERAHEGEA